MDPITRAMRQLAEDGEAFRRAYPERALPLIAREDERSYLVQALRLWENRPENRRPFVVCEMPFAGPDEYLTKVAEQIAQDYEAVRKGVAEEGVALEEYGAPAPLALAAQRAADLLGDRFDGLLIALVPAHVSDAEEWHETVSRLSSSARVCWAVFSPGAEEGARFALDADALSAFLKQTAPAGSLHALLLDAAEAQGAGHHDKAARLYREARAVCQAEGLVEPEATVLVALAGAGLAAGALREATRTYREAAKVAERAGAPALACQAWMGVGGALSARGKRASAAVAYRAAAALARRAGIQPLEKEAVRLLGGPGLR